MTQSLGAGGGLTMASITYPLVDSCEWYPRGTVCPMLQPGHKYYVVVNTWGASLTNSPKKAYIGYSRVTGFTVQ